MTNWIDFLQELTDITDNIARKHFNSRDLFIKSKDNETPVTAGDLEIESVIRALAKEKRPNIGITGEEYAPDKKEINLIIDPIDSTRNFIKGISHFATLLAIEENGTLVAGLISEPVTKNRWWAEKNKGAFYNNKKIQVSDISSLSKAQAFHGSLYGDEAKGSTETAFQLLSKTARQRGFGDYYMHALVAQGTGEFAIDFNLNLWDVAAPKIIIEEAGGMVTDITGDPTTWGPTMISSNGKFHAEIISILNKKDARS